MSVEIESTDILGYTVRLSMDRGATASLTLDNTSLVYDPRDMKEQQVAFYATQSGYADYVKVFHGIVVGGRRKWSPSGERTTELQLVSVFASLSKKPITTQRYKATFKTILTDLLETYGSINSAFFDLSVEPADNAVLDQIVVIENSVTSAVRQLAQACQMECFVDVGGILKTQRYTEFGDATDYTWSRGDVEGFEIAEMRDHMFSVVHVRGRHSDPLEDGTGTAWKGVVQVEMDYFAYEVEIPVVLPRTYSREALLTFEPTVDCYGGGTLNHAFVKAIDAENNTIILGAFGAFGPGTVSLHVDLRNYLTATQLEDENQAKDVVDLEKDRFLDAIKNSGGAGFEQGAYQRYREWRRAQKSGHRSADEPGVGQRKEASVSDSTLVSEIGVRTIEIDNVYITTEDRCTAIGNRAIVEAKQAAEILTFNGPWVPDVALNNKVVVPDPLDDGTFTGCVREIAITYRPQDPLLRASYVVEKLQT